MTYQLLKTLHIVGVIALIGPLLLTPFWLHLYQYDQGRKILSDLHKLTGISGWIVFFTGFLLLYHQDFVLLSSNWIIISIVLFLAIQLFDHFWADRQEEKLENKEDITQNHLKFWLWIKILAYLSITLLMVLK